VLAFSTPLFVVTATATAAAAAGVHHLTVPATVDIVEANAAFAVLAEPERLMQADMDCVQPWVARRFVGEEENDIDFFE
jgi:hypothetical protein